MSGGDEEGRSDAGPLEAPTQRMRVPTPSPAAAPATDAPAEPPDADPTLVDQAEEEATVISPLPDAPALEEATVVSPLPEASALE